MVVVGGAAVVVGVVCGKSVCEESREPPITGGGEFWTPVRKLMRVRQGGNAPPPVVPVLQ